MFGKTATVDSMRGMVSIAAFLQLPQYPGVHGNAFAARSYNRIDVQLQNI
jgi:hypothetical protein